MKRILTVAIVLITLNTAYGQKNNKPILPAMWTEQGKGIVTHYPYIGVGMDLFAPNAGLHLKGDPSPPC